MTAEVLPLSCAFGRAEHGAGDVSAISNLQRTAPARRDTEVRRWLRIAADWGHGDARHLIASLPESDEASCAGTSPGAAGDTGAAAGQDGEVPAPGRPVRVEDTEFYSVPVNRVGGWC
ncbi:hypothetical protein [Streptomyces brevispora]|uniref:Uncharacterized protein n=1 Tax=Streptomyces brevispora TaxID=887462 RepID=A0ABZ1GD27_9ACTN|nr:hypothetical protein [Streptomyces brevispora]WSC16979.1 hypothetical protein OIE64_31870 [Streptomyces brevispora]